MCSPWYGAQRPKWLGPLPYDYPAWLPGDAPGDYAFDVASLSAEEGKFDKYFELEVIYLLLERGRTIGVLTASSGLA